MINTPVQSAARRGSVSLIYVVGLSAVLMTLWVSITMRANLRRRDESFDQRRDTMIAAAEAVDTLYRSRDDGDDDDDDGTIGLIRLAVPEIARSAFIEIRPLENVDSNDVDSSEDASPTRLITLHVDGRVIDRLRR